MKKLKIYSKRHIAILIIFLIIVLLSIAYMYLPFIQPIRQEIENRSLDRYNFEQLEKIKSILSEIPREEYKFRNFPDFNKQYNLTIDPRKDCYYLVATKYFEGEDYIDKDLGYIFGTKIHSKKYLKKYPEGYYVYPKYDLPPWERCFGDIFGDSGDYFCYDHNIRDMERIISNICK